MSDKVSAFTAFMAHSCSIMNVYAIFYRWYRSLILIWFSFEEKYMRDRFKHDIKRLRGASSVLTKQMAGTHESFIHIFTSNSKWSNSKYNRMMNVLRHKWPLICAHCSCIVSINIMFECMNCHSDRFVDSQNKNAGWGMLKKTERYPYYTTVHECPISYITTD